jgi:hypothetical protein
MSRLLANQNTLQMHQGVEGSDKWEYWVFKKPLTQLDNECEDLWLERLMHTAMAIEDQIEFTESQPYGDIAIQKSEVRLLTNRLRDFIDVIGFVPSIKGIEEPEIFEPNVKINKPQNKRKPYPRDASVKQETKFRQYLRKRLNNNFNLSIGNIWNELHSSQNMVIEDLIEVTSVSGLMDTSRVYWMDDSTGNEGKPLTRKSVTKAMSEIRKDIKIKIK